MRITKQQTEEILQLSFTSDTAVDDAQVRIQEILDKAIAHGMTLSARLCEKHDDEAYSGAGKCHLDILTARDNKVWRKE